MLAAPWAEEFSDAKRDPTDQPKAASDHYQHQVQGVVDRCSDKELLMATPRAVRSNPVLSHYLGATKNVK
ncbi:MAG TPA: hypothetical protein VHY22_10485 [Chthoniobacteraceae bacterium]|jgi:hypothetical protein|nr:hypothetical protein [Chthoniobacteraceae bacterium]